MPLFTREAISKFFEGFIEALNFLSNIFSDFITFIRSTPMIYFPMLAIALFIVLIFIVSVIISVSDSAYGTPINTKNIDYPIKIKQFNNPNNYYSTTIPAVNQIWHLHNRNKRNKLIEEEKEAKNQERIRLFEEGQALANTYFENNPKAFRISLNGFSYFRDGWQYNQREKELYNEGQALAKKYFENNPNSFRISINGFSFFRDGWQNKNWSPSKDGKIRQTVHYKMNPDTMELDETYVTYYESSDYEPFDLSKYRSEDDN